MTINRAGEEFIGVWWTLCQRPDKSALMLRFIRQLGDEAVVEPYYSKESDRTEERKYLFGRWQIGEREGPRTPVALWKTITVEAATALLSALDHPKTRALNAWVDDEGNVIEGSTLKSEGKDPGYGSA